MDVDPNIQELGRGKGKKFVPIEAIRYCTRVYIFQIAR